MCYPSFHYIYSIFSQLIPASKINDTFNREVPFSLLLTMLLASDGIKILIPALSFLIFQPITQKSFLVGGFKGEG